MLLGCAKENAPSSAETPTKAASNDLYKDSLPGPEPFTNAEGKLICPVMGTTIESPDKAVGYEDYKGKRYYFCCDGCPDEFHANPEKFKDGKR